MNPSRLEALVAAALLALALALLIPALDMPMGSAGNPGPGVLPAAVLLLLAVCSAALLASRWRKRSERPAAEQRPSTGNRKIWFTLIALAITSLVFEPLGYRLSILALLVVLLRLYSTLSLARIAFAALIATAAVWLFFERLLAVQLPAGIL